MDESAVAQGTEHAVLLVLAGTSLNEAAATAPVEPTDLAEAVEVYRQAGRQALERQAASGWWQIYIQFIDWNTAEQSAADTIVPLLHRAEEDGLVTKWWFMRKHPCWRLRLHPGPDGHAMRDRLRAALDELATDDRIARWWPGIYEAETPAFGDWAGMEAAHDLFYEDSRAVMHLAHNGDVGLGRRELSLLLCNILVRAAGLEWYEQGDVWHRVAQERPLPKDVSAAKLTAMASDLKQLMLANVAPDGPLLRTEGPLASSADWANAFRQAGQKLGSAARAGTLQRGLREVLSYLVIFHWNRLGLPARTQSILAWAARTAILGLPEHMSPNPTSAEPIPRSPGPTPTVHADESAAERALVRFPLVSQHRFPCPDLETQVRKVRDCASSCREPTTADERINRACTVWNLSALLAADCGLPDVAIDLCQRQFQVFRTAAAPLSGGAAIASLQPLVNLARLTRRAGAPEAAHRELEAINHAVHNGGKALIHGELIDFDGLIASKDSTVDTWLRQVMREDGTRALVAAGQWMNAAAHAEKYDDERSRLREARQTCIIALALNGQVGSALELVDNTVTSDDSEWAVAACLRSYLLLNDRGLGAGDVIDMLNAVRRVCWVSDRPTRLFRVRLGLVGADLAIAAQVDAGHLCTELIEDAERSGDALVAREVLAHPGCRALATPNQAETLELVVERAGFDAGQIPEVLLAELMASVQAAGTVLTETLGGTTSGQS
ncbi:thiopeptide-type bacteriocin biosynthesis protein [Amycolatopsis sp. cmx-11-12]|uniref:thiopeptide-type bacteriocin biosynthesis protein n=1 Tax=Amycolatopsis sp. cmx-11-12 TaxID=2785795 RepID=UPI003917FC8A